MSILLDREIAHLKKKLLSFGAMVEEAIARAIHSWKSAMTRWRGP